MTLPSWGQIAKIVSAFVNADTWAERKQIVETNSEVLLSEAADKVLANSLAKYKDDEEATRLLEEHRAVLARCRREGIEVAFTDLVAPGDPPTAVPEEIVEAVLAFANAQTWAESKQIVEARRDVLLTDAADEVLANLLTQYKEDENATRILEQCRALLARCRREGIDAVFVDLKDAALADIVARTSPTASVPQSLVEVVVAFFNVQTWTGKNGS